MVLFKIIMRSANPIIEEHTMLKQRHAIIIGGGIGGLASGIALHRIGWAVSIYEQAAELREVGAGLSLWANAMRALEQLGVAAAVRALQPPMPSGSIYTWRGAPLISDSSAAMAQRIGEISVMLHRADLLSILRHSLPSDTIALGKRCVRIAQDAAGVTAHFADGSQAHGDLLIGCDGIRSAVRAQFIDDSEPAYAGYTAYRAVIPFDTAQIQAGEYWGCGARFGIAPLSGGRLYWFATRNAAAGAHEAPQAMHARLLALFRGWCSPIPDIVAATDPVIILQNDIADRPSLAGWSAGRVTLLGDAAHPMTPNLGQGACQALEDAVILARCLDASTDLEVALHAYEQRRSVRTSQIVRQSRRIGQVGQWQHPLACLLRDLVTRHILAHAQDRQLDQLIGYVV
jgi:2-polyprenyl-6-methoxyphenol hydroxylase-like FAD-dependent oxidoreductase